jgi:hypothetical protein
LATDATYTGFGHTLRDLLIEKGFTSKMGNADYAAFSRKLTVTHYESLRKASPAIDGQLPR